MNEKKLLERKNQLKSARLGDDFNPEQHIDNFLKSVENKLSGRDRLTRPNHTANPNQQPTISNNPASSSNTTPSTNYSSLQSNNNEQKSFLERYWKEMLLGGIFLLGAYYILNQNDNK